MKKITNILSLLFWSGILAIAATRCWFSIKSIVLIFYKVKINEFDVSIAVRIWVTLILLGWLGWSQLSKKKFVLPDTKTINMALLPLVLLIPEWFLPLSCFSPIWFTVIVSFVLCRWLVTMSFRWEKIRHVGKASVLVSLFAVFAVMVWYGWYLQDRGARVMYIPWIDWGIIWNALHNSFNGKFFYSNYMGGSQLAMHFSPALLLLAPIVWLFPGYSPFFLANSLIIFSGGLCLYWLCRTLKISRMESLLLGMMYFFNPAVFNLNMSNFYSFHEIILVFPVMFSCLALYEKKRYVLAALMFILLLLIKETVAVLLLGIGIVLLLRKRYKSGLALTLFCVIFFLVVTKYVMPAIVTGKSEYMVISRFAHLGSNYFEIALSPIMNPKAFWGTVFRFGNFYFVAMLFLPFILLAFYQPILLFPVFIVLAFVCLQSSDQLQNIIVWYHSMPLTMIFIACVYNYKSIKASFGSKYQKWLLAGCGGHCPARRWAVILAVTGVVASIMSWLFFAGTHFSKYTVAYVMARPDCTEMINNFKQVIPKAVPLLASPSVATHFCGRNEVFFHDSDAEFCEYAIFDMSEPMFRDEARHLRDKLLKSGKFKPVMYDLITRHLLVLLAKNPPAGRSYKLSKPILITDSMAYMDVPLDDKNFSLRVILPDKNKSDKLLIQLTCLNKVDYDVTIKLRVECADSDPAEITYFFGDGVFPAYLATPGEAYLQQINLVKGAGKVINVQGKLEKSPVE